MPIVKLPGGSLRDEIRETLYDTLDIEPGDTIQAERNFFAAVQGKAKSLTNLRQNKFLETAVSYRTTGLACDVQNFRAGNFEAIPLILEHSSIEYKVGEKTYWEGPMRFVGGRIRSDLAGTADIYQQHGDASVATVVFTGKHVIDINPLQSFEVVWNINGMTAAELLDVDPAAGTKLRYVFSLKGIKRRPVQ